MNVGYVATNSPRKQVWEISRSFCKMAVRLEVHSIEVNLRLVHLCASGAHNDIQYYNGR